MRASKKSSHAIYCHQKTANSREKTLINMNQVMFCIFFNKNGNPLLKSEKFFGPKISSNASELGLKAYTKFILKL